MLLVVRGLTENPEGRVCEYVTRVLRLDLVLVLELLQLFKPTWFHFGQIVVRNDLEMNDNHHWRRNCRRGHITESSSNRR
jgi:hypothetical protein